MSPKKILEVNNISKKYNIYPGSSARIKEWLLLGHKSFHDEVWALQNISFELMKGEFIGIIGPNGAGKSTLLKIITGALQATEGSYQIFGKALSILELSGGVDDELTGRENLYRSGQLLGFPKNYINSRLDSIKDFSELGEYFERPLRQYSTGMRTRLSFSMFAFMETDVLILDEVLAVGDIFFRQKCFARLEQLIRKKVSIILVTHSLGLVQKYCDRVLLLDRGRLIFDGASGEGVQRFLQFKGEKRAVKVKSLVEDDLEQAEQTATNLRPGNIAPIELETNNVPVPRKFPGVENVSITRIIASNERPEAGNVYKQGDSIDLKTELKSKRNFEHPVFVYEIRDKTNFLVHGKNTLQFNSKEIKHVKAGQRLVIHLKVRLDIEPGLYTFSLGLFSLPQTVFENLADVDTRSLVKNMKRIFRLQRLFAVSVTPRFGERMQLLHAGLSNLPSEGKITVLHGEPNESAKPRKQQ